MNSALYSGWVRHRRFAPKAHDFRYRLTLLWLDLAEMPEAFSQSRLLSTRRGSPMRFQEADYLRQHRQPGEGLADCARRLVQEQLQIDIDGQICLLTQVRSFGLLFNPLSLLYCHNRDGQLQAIIAEVSNTPWLERYAYVLRCDQTQDKQHFRLPKDFHVSPFLPLAVEYRMHFTRPAEQMLVHIEDWQGDDKLFDATLTLQREPLSRSQLRRHCLSFPFMVAKSVGGIYWQALRLLIKRIPLFDHGPQLRDRSAAAPHSAKE